MQEYPSDESLPRWGAWRPEMHSAPAAAPPAEAAALLSCPRADLAQTCGGCEPPRAVGGPFALSAVGRPAHSRAGRLQHQRHHTPERGLRACSGTAEAVGRTEGEAQMVETGANAVAAESTFHSASNSSRSTGQWSSGTTHSRNTHQCSRCGTRNHSMPHLSRSSSCHSTHRIGQWGCSGTSPWDSGAWPCRNAVRMYSMILGLATMVHRRNPGTSASHGKYTPPRRWSCSSWSRPYPPWTRRGSNQVC